MRFCLYPRTDSGRLIVLCGTDGVGKSSLSRALVDHYARVEQSAGLELKQPTDELRQVSYFQRLNKSMSTDSKAARAAVMMAMADRVAACAETVLPALEQGKTVVIDRYVYSGLARLRLWDSDGDHDWYLKATSLLPQPNIAVILTAPRHILRSRLSARDYEFTDDRAFEGVMAVQTALEGIATDFGIPVLNTGNLSLAESIQHVCSLEG